MDYLKLYRTNQLIKKFDLGGNIGLQIGQTLGNKVWNGQKFVDQEMYREMNQLTVDEGISMEDSARLYNELHLPEPEEVTVNPGVEGKDFGTTKADIKDANAAVKDAQNRGIGTNPKGSVPGGGGQTVKNAGIIAGAVIGAQNMIDNATMGDKNFGAQSQAIDTAVHGVSGALMSSGNPYAMAAGAALEGANFLTKMGGKTVEGFDVDIKSSGYGQIGHQDSSSSRDFGAAIGLGGIFGRDKMERKLRERNQQAQMAMKAANIADEIQFEQESRMNSVDDVIQQNEIALQGGIDTSVLI